MRLFYFGKLTISILPCKWRIELPLANVFIDEHCLVLKLVYPNCKLRRIKVTFLRMRQFY